MMFATDAPPFALRRQLSAPAFLRQCLDAAVAVCTLLILAVWFEQPLGAPYLVLSLIIFSLTFPGASYGDGRMRAIARDIVLNWIVVGGILLLFGYASGYIAMFPAPMVLAWYVGVPVMLFAGHASIAMLMSKVIELDGMHRTAVIVGATRQGARLAQQLVDSPLLGIRLAGVFDDRGAERRVAVDGVPALGKIGGLAEYAKAHPVDLIYVTLPMASQPRILNLLEELRDTTASVYFVPDIFMFDLIQARMDTINGIPVVAVCETPFYGVNGIVKTLSDYLIAGTALLVLAPIMAAIAAGVKLTSTGPVLFRQRRYGLDGRQIMVYKFRTMTVLEDGAVVRQATRDDERITRFGRFLRRTSLDELPQFINVLQGRMSVVGPRPHAVAHNETYRKLIDGYMVRHKVKPGVTGWAQVNGLRGETDTIEKMEKRVEFDLAYVRNWSLRLDLLIILKTVLVVFNDKKAY